MLHFKGQYTDSGGGGVKYALQRELTDKQMVADDYIVGTCTLHNLQTALRNNVTHMLGEGGTNEKGEFRMNAMQILHGAYNKHTNHEVEELRGLWAYLAEADGLKFKVLEEPV